MCFAICDKNDLYRKVVVKTMSISITNLKSDYNLPNYDTENLLVASQTSIHGRDDQLDRPLLTH